MTDLRGNWQTERLCERMAAPQVLVEAAGVEPASEIAVSQESSCFVRFR
jgi:hypothetical protein